MHSLMLSVPRLYCHWHLACMFSLLKEKKKKRRSCNVEKIEAILTWVQASHRHSHGLIVEPNSLVQPTNL